MHSGMAGASAPTVSTGMFRRNLHNDRKRQCSDFFHRVQDSSLKRKLMPSGDNLWPLEVSEMVLLAARNEFLNALQVNLCSAVTSDGQQKSNSQTPCCRKQTLSKT